MELTSTFFLLYRGLVPHHHRILYLSLINQFNGPAIYYSSLISKNQVRKRMITINFVYNRKGRK